MASFFVRQEADYAMGHLRYGHREGFIEADSIEDAERKLKDLKKRVIQTISILY